MNEFETAWNEAVMLDETSDKKSLPRIPSGIIGTFQAFLHFLDENHDPRSYRLDDIDLSRLKISDFDGFKEELESLRGKEGQKYFSGTHTYKTGNSIIGKITLKADGTITSNKAGWIFQGTVEAAVPDTYDFNRGNRGFPAEQLVTLGRIAGKMTNATEYKIYVTGTARIQETGSW